MKFLANGRFNGSFQSRQNSQSFISNARLGRLGQWFTAHLTHSNELRVWQAQDGDGRIWWYAYDPTTGVALDRQTEGEMKQWIEAHHRLPAFP